MQFGQYIQDLPIEDWAATVAGFARRVRRRAVRRPGMFALLPAVATAVLLIQHNALLQQQSSHPAPFWGLGVEAQSAERADVAVTSPLVAQIQTMLLEQEPSGILDDETVRQIKVFEAERGLPVTGQPSLGLVAALRTEGDAVVETESASAASYPPVDIRGLQEILNAEGFGPLEVDGVIGPRTRAALARFAQTAQGQAMLSPAAKALVNDPG